MEKRTLYAITVAAALMASSSSAQQNVGIGTNTPHSTALLELYSTSKGLLIPRMTQAERDAISSPATGLLIYQTDNNPGFYYWNGTAWIPLLSSSSGSGLFWSLTGNSGTNPATHFLGTTDAQPLVIRTNDTERMRIDASGNVGIGTNNPQARLHVEGGELWLFNNGSNVRFVIGDNPSTGQYGWIQWDSNLDLFRIDHSAAPGDGLKLNGNFVTIGNVPVDQPLKVALGTTELMRVTTAGDVGIGTATPAARLHVHDGHVAITNSDDAARELRLYEPSGSGMNYTAFRAQAQGADITYTLPASLTPTTTVEAGILQTDASGNLSWLDPSALVAGTAWSLTGNSGTNPATNFLGTTDAQPLVIRVDNQETFRFNAPDGSAPGWSIQRGGGDTRGLHAVDLQSARAAATQVASGDYSVISGGVENTASGEVSTVSGGYLNTAGGFGSVISGGTQNVASNLWSTVGGGAENTASGEYSTIGGGYLNLADGFGGTVGGGWENRARTDFTTVGGGVQNTAEGDVSTVGGGDNNSARGNFSTVGGGRQNTASGAYATVGGGRQNTASGDYATVGGGYLNVASDSLSAIPGGYNLRVGKRSFGFSGQTSTTQTDLSANSNIAAFVDVDLWLYSRDRTQASQLRLYEAQAHSSGAHYVALRAPASLATSTTYTLPASDGSAGQVLTTNGSGQLSWSWSPGTIFVRKTANESVTNSTTLQPDDHLMATLPANSIWEVEFLLRVQAGGSNSSNGGIQVQLSAPTGTTMQVYVEIKKGGGGSDLAHHWQYGWLTNPSSVVGHNPIPATDPTGAVKLKGLVIVGSTGGTLQLYWAQNAANANATTVYANSYMRLTRIQ